VAAAETFALGAGVEALIAGRGMVAVVCGIVALVLVALDVYGRCVSRFHDRTYRR